MNDMGQVQNIKDSKKQEVANDANGIGMAFMMVMDNFLKLKKMTKI